jgi:hypothetical protein
MLDHELPGVVGVIDRAVCHTAGGTMRSSVTILCAVFLLMSSAATSQVVVQSRGVDSRVDYASLKAFGPWDDRNFDLNQTDLEALAANEAELRVPVPAFYRVELRQRFSAFPKTGEVQYPHSAWPRFLIERGGYLINGVLYRHATQMNGTWVVDLDRPLGSVPEGEDPAVQAKALTSDVRVTSPNGAAESAVAISPTNPDLVIAGVNGPSYGQDMHYSTDGGETWSSAAALPLGGTCCDPTVVWSADGSKAYAATLGSSAVYIYRSGDGGQTWNDRVNEPGGDPRREIGSGTDKEYLHLDASPTSPCQGNLHLTWHEGGTMKYSRSTDAGHTWSSAVTVPNGSTYSGIGSDITSDPSGAVYYFWPATGAGTIRMVKSTDCGASFASPSTLVADTIDSYDFAIPSMDYRRVFIYVSAAADHSDGPYAGSIYASWTDNTAPEQPNPVNNHARIQVAYSRNGGDSWTVTTPHETADSSAVDRWHEWLAVGPDGTVHVVYYDTRNDPTRQSVDLYWAYSTDGAQTWSTPERLTTVISPEIEDTFEFGDYNGLDVVMNRLIAIFTDNRNEGGGASDSVDVYAAGRTLATDQIFSDGFDMGNTDSWSSVQP